MKIEFCVNDSIKVRANGTLFLAQMAFEFGASDMLFSANEVLLEEDDDEDW